MSRSARRLASSVTTDRFHWQRTADSHGKVPIRPVAVIFNQSREKASAAADSHQDVEAREVHLPSVAAERLQAIEREAYAEGYAAGERAAEADAAERLTSARAELAATVDHISALRKDVMHRAERDLLRLALAIGNRIVRREIDIDPDLLLVIARLAIDRLGERALAVVHLNPADLRALSTSPRPDSTLELVADPSVPVGGCRIESSFGQIDAGIDAQIRELSRELLSGDLDEEPVHGHVLRD